MPPKKRTNGPEGPTFNEDTLYWKHYTTWEADFDKLPIISFLEPQTLVWDVRTQRLRNRCREDLLSGPSRLSYYSHPDLDLLREFNHDCFGSDATSLKLFLTCAEILMSGKTWTPHVIISDNTVVMGVLEILCPWAKIVKTDPDEIELTAPLQIIYEQDISLHQEVMAKILKKNPRAQCPYLGAAGLVGNYDLNEVASNLISLWISSR